MKKISSYALACALIFAGIFYTADIAEAAGTNAHAGSGVCFSRLSPYSNSMAKCSGEGRNDSGNSKHADVTTVATPVVDDHHHHHDRDDHRDHHHFDFHDRHHVRFHAFGPHFQFHFHPVALHCLPLHHHGIHPHR